jgi:hypothetical protein
VRPPPTSLSDYSFETIASRMTYVVSTARVS